MLLALLLACTGAPDDSGEGLGASVSFLSPVDGDTVTAGDVAVSIVVDGFTLHAPAKHNEGEAAGYVAVSVDGAEVLTTGETQFTLPLVAGAHTLTAELHFEDGDALEPPATATIDITVE